MINILRRNSAGRMGAFLYRYRLILFFVILKMIIQLTLVPHVWELHRDEYLYLAEGSHLALGYLEVPPVLSLFARLIHLCGDGIFWVRFWPALFGSLNLFFLGAMIIKLGGQFFAQLIACLAFLLSVFLRTSMLFQPNAFEYLCWIIMALIIINYINTNNSKWLIWFGVVAGIALMNKYSSIFFLIGILAGAFATPVRVIFKRRAFYFGLLITFLIVLPNIWWQYQHAFPFFHHMAELKRTQLDNISPTSFLINQLLICLPGLFLWIGGLYALFFRTWARPYLILGCSYFVVFVRLL